MTTEISKPIPSLQIQTFGQLVKLTYAQRTLLETITTLVVKNQSLTWDIIVKTYCKGVRSEYQVWENRDWVTYNIQYEYRKQSVKWTYTIRGLIKGWLLNTIGTLVIKNQLAIIPLIEIE